MSVPWDHPSSETSMGKTISEKILSLHSGREAKASDLVLAEVDRLMGHEWNTPLTIQALKDMGAEKIFDPKGAVFVVDYASAFLYDPDSD